LCCCSQGTSSLEAEFNKNVFTPDEVATVELKINNSNCRIGVKKVTFSIIQQVQMKICEHHFAKTYTIIKDSCIGATAGERLWSKTLSFNLADIKYEVADMKKGRHGTIKKVSDAEKFMMASLQPACHTHNF